MSLFSKKVAISIPKACHEDWEKMLDQEKGKFCLSCQKTVVDFSQKSDAEIIAFLSQNQHFCGKFREDQLKIYTLEKSNWQIPLKAFALFVASFFVNHVGLQAQNQTELREEVVQKNLKREKRERNEVENTFEIKGTVLDEVGNGFIGANIMIKGTNIGTFSGLNGIFNLKNIKNTDSLVFSFVGYLEKNISYTDFLINPVVKIEIDPKFEQMVIQAPIMQKGRVLVGGTSVKKVYYSRYNRFWQSVKNFFRRKD